MGSHTLQVSIPMKNSEIPNAKISIRDSIGSKINCSEIFLSNATKIRVKVKSYLEELYMLLLRPLGLYT